MMAYMPSLKTNCLANLQDMTRIKDEEFLKAFGANLRKVREEKKISMRALADYSNVEYSQISRIEKGQINTTISTVKVLADALGINGKELFDFNY
tara:strand:+ start:5256 stop:5540 length:285 start_codon:yes stop_codon:yes gene_type:complete